MRNNNALSIFDEMDNFFDDFFKPAKYDMKSDIREVENGYEIDVEVPGFNKDEVVVDYDDGYLTVSAKHSENKEDKKHKYIHQERTYSTLERSYYVGNIDKSKVNAKLNNGLLTISVPKASLEAPKGKTIMIE